MERFKISCQILDKTVELQFDFKRIPGEVGPCYMVSTDGLFKGYIKKDKSGFFKQLAMTEFTKEELLAINIELAKLPN